MKPEDNDKDYHSTTPEPFKPEKSNQAPLERPDKTKKKEKNDPTREIDPDITSQPGNLKQKKRNSSCDETEPGTAEGSIMNRTDV